MRSRPPGFAGSFGDQKSQGFAGCEGGRCTRTEPCFDELAGFDDSMTVTNRDRGSRFHSAADGKVVRHGMSLVSYDIRSTPVRSEERRVGKEGVRTGRTRWSPYHYKKKEARDTRTEKSEIE